MRFMLRKLITKVITKLFPLVKEIKSREGVVHFRRYAIVESRWFNVYVHQILHRDEDKDPHSHPWDYVSIILRGGYRESVIWPKHIGQNHWRYTEAYTVNHPVAGMVMGHTTSAFHQIMRIDGPTWTLVLTGRKKHFWGYMTEDRGFVNHITYRKQKNAAPVNSPYR